MEDLEEEEGGADEDGADEDGAGSDADEDGGAGASGKRKRGGSKGKVSGLSWAASLEAWAARTRQLPPCGLS
jgi:hypothetical protein